jgi:hypothetical protein
MYPGGGGRAPLLLPPPPHRVQRHHPPRAPSPLASRWRRRWMGDALCGGVLLMIRASSSISK